MKYVATVLILEMRKLRHKGDMCPNLDEVTRKKQSQYLYLYRLSLKPAPLNTMIFCPNYKSTNLVFVIIQQN